MRRKWKFRDDTDDVWFDQVGDAGGIILHVVLRSSRGEALVAECIGDAVKEYSKAWHFSCQVTACHRRSNCKGEQAEKLESRNWILCCFLLERSSRTPLVHLRTARWQWIRLIGPWTVGVCLTWKEVRFWRCCGFIKNSFSRVACHSSRPDNEWDFARVCRCPAV